MQSFFIQANPLEIIIKRLDITTHFIIQIELLFKRNRNIERSAAVKSVCLFQNFIIMQAQRVLPGTLKQRVCAKTKEISRHIPFINVQLYMT